MLSSKAKKKLEQQAVQLQKELNEIGASRNRAQENERT
jgi:hypothetical protein